MAAGFERGIEDRRVETRIAGINDDVGAHGSCQLDDVGRVARIDTCGANPITRCLCGGAATALEFVGDAAIGHRVVVRELVAITDVVHRHHKHPGHDAAVG